jgi:F420-dependent oxidoreductase-like protein
VKLAWRLGGWTPGDAALARQVAAAAGELGLDSLWLGETYGADAISPMAWLGTTTDDRVRLGTAILPMAARSAASTAMTALTLDHLTGGRFCLGLGLSGPAVISGWHRAPDRPALRSTREYIEAVRAAMTRQRTDPANPYAPRLRSALPSLPDRIPPVLLAAQGPANVALAAEVADGWITFLTGPELIASSPVGRDGPSETVAIVFAQVGDSVADAARVIRERVAFYIAAMGTPERNYHRQSFERMGFGAECERIAGHYGSGDRDSAAAEVTLDMIDQVALVGPPERIAALLPAWQRAGVCVLALNGSDFATVRTVARLMADAPQPGTSQPGTSQPGTSQPGN